MKPNITSLLFFACTIASSMSSGYDISTHYLVGRAAFAQSDLATPGKLENLGLKQLALQQQFSTTAGFNSAEFSLADTDAPCSHSLQETVPRLIACGAMFEDFFPTRVLNHFFDPAHGGSPLMITSLVGPAGLLPPPILFFDYTSPDWALGQQLGVGAQDFSYAMARGYYFSALTEPDPLLRAAAWGKTFQSVGQIIHHLADMAQPQHVRNDPHLDLLNDLFNDANLGLINHASRFERYAAQNGAMVKGLLQNGGAPVYPVYSGNFTVPRAFWVGNGKGIAEFTNSNFVSIGTNFVWQGQALPNPDFVGGPIPSFPHDESMASLFGLAPPKNIDNLCNDHINPPVIYLYQCFMTFYSSTVFDNLTGTSSVNGHASTYSVFDEDLALHQMVVSIPGPTEPPLGPNPMVLPTIQTTKIFALNHFNFDTALGYLIPRATAFSAGLINYFFRGNLEISAPDEGVYALIDQSPGGCGTPCGFTTIKLKVRNTTPSGEQMGPGNLLVVAKYHVNMCYQPDLSGEFDGTAFAGDSCRSPDEFIAVSNPVAVGLVPADAPTELPFTFSNLFPIPINASDVFLQVVFQGTLGQEVGAVAVSTLDIAEPNYFAFANMTDYAYDTSDNLYHPLGTYNFPLTMTNIRLQFDSGAGSPVATLDSLQAGGHAQVAYLADKGSVGLYIQYDYPGETIPPYATTEPVNEFTADDDTGPYTRTCPVKKLRGLYRDDMFFVWQYVHGVVSIINLSEPNAPQGGVLQGSRFAPKAASGGAICVSAASLTGVKDFSQMTPQSINTAAVWSISF